MMSVMPALMVNNFRNPHMRKQHVHVPKAASGLMIVSEIHSAVAESSVPLSSKKTSGSKINPMIMKNAPLSMFVILVFIRAEFRYGFLRMCERRE